MALERRVTPERLDNLPPDDPLALRSRRDLQRVHRAMRSVSILKHAMTRLPRAAPLRSILELGAGDGTLLLRFAQALQPRWTGVDLTFLDRQDLISGAVREAFRRLNWRVTVICTDALEWARSEPVEHYDLCITTLFLHHFDSMDLGVLLGAVAARSEAFIACEPRRDGVARLGSRLIGLLCANEVTREDGVKSVAAGFAGRELTQLWSRVRGKWLVDEYREWPFTHCFLAARSRTGEAGDHDEH